MGSALALLLKEKGYPVAGVASRSYSSAQRLAGAAGCPAYGHPEEAARAAELVFITTPDREIAPVSRAIAERGGFRAGQVVAHTSGAHPSGELEGVREAGALAVSIHPLQSFADLDGARQNLPGSYIALEGDEEALPLARQVAEDLGGKPFIIRAQDKVLYHAAACIASNYLVSLMYLATKIYARFGLSQKEAFAALYPLVQGTVNNIRALGPAQALTGPIARGDAGTVAGHLGPLEEVGRLEAQLYRLLGLYTVRVALEKGTIGEEQAGQLAGVLLGKDSVGEVLPWRSCTP